jgi:hypothetical protein
MMKVAPNFAKNFQTILRGSGFSGPLRKRCAHLPPLFPGTSKDNILRIALLSTAYGSNVDLPKMWAENVAVS